MRVRAIVLVPLVMLLFSLSSQVKLYAAVLDDWQKLIEEGSHYKFDGHYKDALQSFTKAVAIAQNEKLPPQCLPTALCRLADVEVTTNQISQADVHFKKIVDLMKEQKTAATLDSKVNFWAAVLADSYMSNTKPETRETCLKRACYLKTLIYGDTNKGCLDCLNKLAECYIANGKTDKAIRLLTMTNDAMDKKYGKDPDRLGNQLHNLAIKCQKEHKCEQAKQLELVVIELAQVSNGYLALGLPAFYSLLGLNALVQGKMAENRECFNKALKECSKVKNSHKEQAVRHAMEFILWGNPIDSNCPKEKLSIVEASLRHTLAMTCAITAQPGWQCNTLQSLSDVLYNEGKNKESDKCMLRAIEIAKTPHCYAAIQVPDLYMGLALRYNSRRSFDKANAAFADALKNEKDKNGYHAALILFWWGYSLNENKQLNLAAQKLEAAFKLARVVPAEKRGTLLADILLMAANTEFTLHKQKLADMLNSQSITEIQLQKKLKTKIGPDFFQRMK